MPLCSPISSGNDSSSSPNCSGDWLRGCSYLQPHRRPNHRAKLARCNEEGRKEASKACAAGSSYPVPGSPHRYAWRGRDATSEGGTSPPEPPAKLMFSKGPGDRWGGRGGGVMAEPFDQGGICLQTRSFASRGSSHSQPPRSTASACHPHEVHPK